MSGSQAERHPQFTEVARAYDELMAGVPYRRWVDYVEKLLKQVRASPRTVLDIACGTGNVTFALADRGYEVAGVDLSAPMLAIARRKACRYRRDIPFFQGDMRCLSLPERYDLAVCLYDSLNYLLSPDDVQQAFASAYRVLHPGGHYIFGVNTIYALREPVYPALPRSRCAGALRLAQQLQRGDRHRRGGDGLLGARAGACAALHRGSPRAGLHGARVAGLVGARGLRDPRGVRGLLLPPATPGQRPALLCRPPAVARTAGADYR